MRVLSGVEDPIPFRVDFVPSVQNFKTSLFWTAFCMTIGKDNMPWYNGDYPPSYKNQPPELRAKAVEIANSLLENGAPEGIAIATGLKKAREFFENKKAEEKKDFSRDWSKTDGSRRP